MDAPLRIEAARSGDLPAVLALLAENGLPEARLSEHLGMLLVARMGDEVVGSAGLELYPDGALLRSVAVAAPLRGRRLGHALTEAALHLAAERGARRVYLLTTTAERFFPRFGFEPTRRELVPPGVRSSPEFTSACPASAHVLAATLSPEAGTAASPPQPSP